MNVKEKTCCFTGHRIILKEHFNGLPQKLEKTISGLFDQGIRDFITGGALGFDTLAAKAVLAVRQTNPSINLILALPCRNQTNGWHQKNIDEYHSILRDADEIIYVSEEYHSGCLLQRNRFMIENSSHCIFYMTYPRGGTAYTVKYALENELEMHNIIFE